MTNGIELGFYLGSKICEILEGSEKRSFVGQPLWFNLGGAERFVGYFSHIRNPDLIVKDSRIPEGLNHRFLSFDSGAKYNEIKLKAGFMRYRETITLENYFGDVSKIESLFSKAMEIGNRKVVLKRGNPHFNFWDATPKIIVCGEKSVPTMIGHDFLSLPRR